MGVLKDGLDELFDPMQKNNDELITMERLILVVVNKVSLDGETASL